jgi:hypothetical protein
MESKPRNYRLQFQSGVHLPNSVRIKKTDMLTETDLVMNSWLNSFKGLPGTSIHAFDLLQFPAHKVIKGLRQMTLQSLCNGSQVPEEPFAL